MIGYLRGKLLLWRDDYLLVDVHGVGYQVYVPTSTLNHLPLRGEEISLYIYTAVREDAITLYGFQTEAELDLFKILITVSGIGPKVASGILSGMDVGVFKRAIVFEDLPLLKKVPGIGEKTAKRLILELKSKVQLDPEDTPAETIVPQKMPLIEEAADALTTLGYSRSEAYAAIGQIEERDDLQKMIRQALKYLGQGRS